MGFMDFGDSRTLYLEAKQKCVGLTTGNYFRASDIERTVKHYETLFSRFPEMGFIVLEPPLMEKKSITMNDTNFDSRIFARLVLGSLKDEATHYPNDSPREFIRGIVRTAATYEDDDTLTSAAQYLREDVGVDHVKLGYYAQTLPKEWKRVFIRVGNKVRSHVQEQLSIGEPSIEQLRPTRAERQAAGW